VAERSEVGWEPRARSKKIPTLLSPKTGRERHPSPLAFGPAPDAEIEQCRGDGAVERGEGGSPITVLRRVPSMACGVDHR
jgi:hypothetical protein